MTKHLCSFCNFYQVRFPFYTYKLKLTTHHDGPSLHLEIDFVQQNRIFDFSSNQEVHCILVSELYDSLRLKRYVKFLFRDFLWMFNEVLVYNNREERCNSKPMHFNTFMRQFWDRNKPKDIDCLWHMRSM